MKFATKAILHCPPHLRHVATLHWEIENSNFCRYSAHMEENANKLHFKCTDFYRIAVGILSVCLSVRLSVCPSDACIVTKLNNALRIF